MSWLFSQALVVEYLGENFSDGEQSVPLSGNPTQLAYCAPDKMTGFSRLSRFGMTFKPLTENLGEELLMLYLEAFHVPTLVQPEKGRELTEKPPECGEKWRASFTKYDPDSSSWKTHQCLLLGDLEEFSETWPQWGLMLDGECWEQQMSALPTSGTESGSEQKQMWLTPRVVEVDETPENFRRRMNSKRPNDRKNGFGSLTMQVKAMQKWPTPKCQDSRHAISRHITDPDGMWKGNLGEVVMSTLTPTTGRLNPTWVEWLMGWPLGWTDLNPLVTDKSHCVQQQPGDY